MNSLVKELSKHKNLNPRSRLPKNAANCQRYRLLIWQRILIHGQAVCTCSNTDNTGFWPDAARRRTWAVSQRVGGRHHRDCLRVDSIQDNQGHQKIVPDHIPHCVCGGLGKQAQDSVGVPCQNSCMADWPVIVGTAPRSHAKRRPACRHPTHRQIRRPCPGTHHVPYPRFLYCTKSRSA